MCRQRQLFTEIDVAMHDLLHRRRFNLFPRQRVERRVLKARQHLGRKGAIAQDFAHALVQRRIGDIAGRGIAHNMHGHRG